MNYPEFLKEKGTIGICAPSFGCSDSPYIERYENAIKRFKRMGYTIKETPHTKTYECIASADAKTRANEFMELYFDDSVDFIFSCGGGEIMMEILPYIDFEKIKNHKKPKYFMGYSDNTNLTFLLPVLCEVPAIYGLCFPSFGMVKWNKESKNAYEVLTGKKDLQIPYPKYRNIHKNIDCGPLENDHYTILNQWKRYDKKESVTIQGRLLGGCMDILLMLCGTKYDRVRDFNHRHEEGVVWFLEACDLNILAQKRGYFQLKEAGWFENCNGILIGRPLHKEKMFDQSYVDMMEEFNSLGVPILYDMDFGHVNPMMTLIEGSYVEVQYDQENPEQSTIKTKLI